MRAWRELRRRWDQASLEYDLAHGRRPYGRSDLSATGRPLEEVEMPVFASIDATIIRADGSVEELGTVADNQEVVLTGEQIARMHAVAARQARRKSR